MDDRSGADRRRMPRGEPDRRVNDPVPPHSIEAEKAVLGALMVRPDTFTVLPAQFGESLFYRMAHQLVFRAIEALHERRVEIDLLTVSEELKRTSDLDRIGGPAYLSALVDGVPRAVNAPYYAKIVAEHASRRGVIGLAEQLLQEAYAAQSSPDDLIAHAQQGVIGVSGRGSGDGIVAVRDLIPQARAAFEEAVARREPVIGVPTGFGELDGMTAGLQRGELVLLAARPSVGKTAMAANIAEYVGLRGFVLIFSLEMTKEAILRRMVSARARVEGHSLRTGHLSREERERVIIAMEDIEQLGLIIDDTSGLPVEDLWRRSRRAVLEHGPLMLVVIDYLQMLSTRARYENRTQQVSFVSASLKGLAKELNVPVLALSQLSRHVEGRKDKRPTLADLRESGALEQDADVVLFLHRQGEDDEERPAEVILAKQRNGPVGTIKLWFHKEYTRFDNLSHAAGERDD